MPIPIELLNRHGDKATVSVEDYTEAVENLMMVRHISNDDVAKMLKGDADFKFEIINFMQALATIKLWEIQRDRS